MSLDQSNFVILEDVLKKYTGTAMDIIIPESVTAIDKRAFWHCSEKLQSITLSAGITIIPEYAFSDCENLQSVTLPESLTVIGSYAFWNCRNLQSILNDNHNIADKCYDIVSLCRNKKR